MSNAPDPEPSPPTEQLPTAPPTQVPEQYGQPPYRQPPYGQPQNQPPYGQPQYGQQPWSQPPAAPYSPAAPMAANPFDSETTVVLVCGILSLVVCGLIGIVAWVQGNSLKNRAEAAGWPEPGTGKVGRILGIVGTCIGALQLLLFVGYAVVFIGILAGSSTTG